MLHTKVFFNFILDVDTQLHIPLEQTNSRSKRHDILRIYKSLLLDPNQSQMHPASRFFRLHFNTAVLSKAYI